MNPIAVEQLAERSSSFVEDARRYAGRLIRRGATLTAIAIGGMFPTSAMAQITGRSNSLRPNQAPATVQTTMSLTSTEIGNNIAYNDLEGTNEGAPVSISMSAGEADSFVVTDSCSDPNNVDGVLSESQTYQSPSSPTSGAYNITTNFCDGTSSSNNWYTTNPNDIPEAGEVPEILSQLQSEFGNKDPGQTATSFSYDSTTGIAGVQYSSLNTNVAGALDVWPQASAIDNSTGQETMNYVSTFPETPSEPVNPIFSSVPSTVTPGDTFTVSVEQSGLWDIALLGNSSTNTPYTYNASESASEGLILKSSSTPWQMNPLDQPEWPPGNGGTTQNINFEVPKTARPDSRVCVYLGGTATTKNIGFSLVSKVTDQECATVSVEPKYLSPTLAMGQVLRYFENTYGFDSLKINVKNEVVSPYHLVVDGEPCNTGKDRYSGPNATGVNDGMGMRYQYIFYCLADGGTQKILRKSLPEHVTYGSKIKAVGLELAHVAGVSDNLHGDGDYMVGSPDELDIKYSPISKAQEIVPGARQVEEIKEILTGKGVKFKESFYPKAQPKKNHAKH